MPSIAGPPLTAGRHAAALRFPLSVDRALRARRFCNTYGLTRRAGLIETVERRLAALSLRLETRAASGDLAFQQHLDAGQTDMYRREMEFVHHHRVPWQYALDLDAETVPQSVMSER